MYKTHTQPVKKAIQVTQCIYCGYEQHLSIDIQCPVVGIGETLDNQQLLAKYGTLEAALQAHGLEPQPRRLRLSAKA
jgi:hypothetical protein